MVSAAHRIKFPRFIARIPPHDASRGKVSKLELKLSQPLLRSVKRKNSDCFATGAANWLSAAIWDGESGVKSRAICTFCSNWAILSQPTITVLTGCDRVKRIASVISMTPERVAIAEPSQECCCVQAEVGSSRKQSAACGNLHADDAHLLLDRQGEQLIGEAVNVGIGRVERHQDGVKRMAIHASISASGRKWPVTPRKRTTFCCFIFKQSFHGAALGEDRVDVLGQTDVVQLPQIHVIGVQQVEGLFDHAHRAVTRALFGFGGQESLAVGRVFITWPT